jgi:hypothetical protein
MKGATAFGQVSGLHRTEQWVVLPRVPRWTADRLTGTMRTGEPDGIWGSTTVEERRHLRAPKQRYG